jgi:ketosteroid isomerase-like protein
LFPPGAARVDGRADIQAFWQGAIDGGLSDLTLKTIEVEANGATAYEVGALTLKAPGENGAAATTVLGKYIVLWKNGADGSWRLHRDIWNITPAAPAQ